MPIDRKLLEILVCPITKQPLSPLDATRLARVNAHIAQGQAQYLDGATLRQPLRHALVTENGATIYAVEEHIPILLEACGIPTAQFPDW